MSTTSTIPRLLRLPRVIELTGLGRDSIYRLGKAGKFPRPRKLTENGNASAWREDEVVAWIESRPVAGANGTPEQPTQAA